MDNILPIRHIESENDKIIQLSYLSPKYNVSQNEYSTLSLECETYTNTLKTKKVIAEYTDDLLLQLDEKNLIGINEVNSYMENSLYHKYNKEISDEFIEFILESIDINTEVYSVYMNRFKRWIFNFYFKLYKKDKFTLIEKVIKKVVYDKKYLHHFDFPKRINKSNLKHQLLGIHNRFLYKYRSSGTTYIILPKKHYGLLYEFPEFTNNVTFSTSNVLTFMGQYNNKIKVYSYTGTKELYNMIICGFVPSGQLHPDEGLYATNKEELEFNTYQSGSNPMHKETINKKVGKLNYLLFSLSDHIYTHTFKFK